MNTLQRCIYSIFSFLAVITFACEAKRYQPCPAPTQKTNIKPVVVKTEPRGKTVVTTEPLEKSKIMKPERVKTVEPKIEKEIKPETPKETQKPSEQKKGGEVYSINSIEELNKYIGEYDRVIIDIYASWCGPCKSFAPIYEEFAKKHPDIICLKIDGEKVPAVKNKYKPITGYPTFVLYKNKTKIEQFSGSSPTLARFEERAKALI